MPSPPSSPSSDAERPTAARQPMRDRTDRILGSACGGRPNLQPAAAPGSRGAGHRGSVRHRVLAPVRRPMLDLNGATIQGTGGLLERLAAITDPRAKRGCVTGWCRCWRSRLLRQCRAPRASSRLGSSPPSCPRRRSPGWAPGATPSPAATSRRTRRPCAGRSARSTLTSWTGCSAAGSPSRPTQPPATAVTSSYRRSRSTARRCAAPEAPTAGRCSYWPRCSTVRAPSSRNAKSTTPPTRSPSSARCWTTSTCTGWS
jgi:hypothetical protein